MACGRYRNVGGADAGSTDDAALSSLAWKDEPADSIPEPLPLPSLARWWSEL